MASILRHEIIAEFRTEQLSLDPAAIKLLQNHVDEGNGGRDMVMAVVAAVKDALGSAEEPVKVTAPMVEQALASWGGEPSQLELMEVISAFETPRVKFDVIRQHFYPCKEAPTLHGSAKDKLQLYLDRLLILQQRLRRHPLFNKPALSGMGGSHQDYCEVPCAHGQSALEQSSGQLSEIKALLGCVGERRYVMGCISQLEDGKYFLEDLSGRLQLDLTHAETTEGFYTENCVVVTEGELDHRDIFKVAALGFPPVEDRHAAQAAIKGVSFFGGSELRQRQVEELANAELLAGSDRMVVLSDVWLDSPEVMDQLQTLFTGFDGLDTVPSVFVLMGNFQSSSCGAPSTNYVAVKEHFAALAAMICQHKNLMEHSKFVFVPGPGDAGPSSVLPQPPLRKQVTAALREKVPGAVFTSNPCRLRLYNQQVVIFRGNVQARMRRLCLVPPTGDTSSAEVMFQHLCVTVLQQCHLCPLPLEHLPIYWQYDHALHLYPAPDVVVLADTTPQATIEFGGCCFINPGAFRTAAFAAYNPAEREVELSEIPPPD